MTGIPAAATHFRIYRWEFGDLSDPVETTECLLDCHDGFKVNTMPVSRVDYLTREAILQVWGPGHYRVTWLRFDRGSVEVVQEEASFMSIRSCDFN